MPVWCWELQEVPSHDNPWEFTQKVCSLFEVPMAQSCTIGVDNDHSTPLAHWSLEKYKFMPTPDPWFGSRDYQLVQPQQILAYGKALQYWVEKGQPPIPGKPLCLAESVFELRWLMEPVVSFIDEEVPMAAASSNWVEVTMPRPAEPTQQTPTTVTAIVTAATPGPIQRGP